MTERLGGQPAGVEEAVARVDAHEEVGEDDRDDGHELHHDVERGPRRVLLPDTTPESARPALTSVTPLSEPRSRP